MFELTQRTLALDSESPLLESNKEVCDFSLSLVFLSNARSSESNTLKSLTSSGQRFCHRLSNMKGCLLKINDGNEIQNRKLNHPKYSFLQDSDKDVSPQRRKVLFQ